MEFGEISLFANGEKRQASDLSLMIWNVPEIISNLSTQYDLVPKDLIFTGTPAGVGPVKPGDELVVKIEGLDDLTVTIGGHSNTAT